MPRKVWDTLTRVADRKLQAAQRRHALLLERLRRAEALQAQLEAYLSDVQMRFRTQLSGRPVDPMVLVQSHSFFDRVQQARQAQQNEIASLGKLIEEAKAALVSVHIEITKYQKLKEKESLDEQAQAHRKDLKRADEMVNAMMARKMHKVI